MEALISQPALPKPDRDASFSVNDILRDFYKMWLKNVWFFTFVIFCAAVLPAAIFGQITPLGGEHPWRSFVLEFQTLISGILAIIAAVATIGQMRASDAEAADRHRQSLRASTMEERKTVNQFAWRISRASYLSSDASSRYSNLNIEAFDHLAPTEANKVIARINADIDEIAAEVNHEVVQDVEFLLGIDRLRNLNTIRSALKKYYERINSLHQAHAFIVFLTPQLAQFDKQVRDWRDETLFLLGDDPPTGLHD